MRSAVGIIPARYGSKRFPGKSLAIIAGKTLIQRVFEKVKTARLIEKIIVATDDERIIAACGDFGAEAWMTSPTHNTGTERIAEVAGKLDAPIIINIQGDEPLINGSIIDSLVNALQDGSVPMATLAFKENDISLLSDQNAVKAVMDKNGNALYFSRSPVPFRASDYFWYHVGLYGYQRDFLLKFSSLPVSRLEQTEKLEQLRVLENGFPIKILETPYKSLSVNTPEDIILVERILKIHKDE